MGQKVNPISYRVGFNRTWESRWFAKKANYAKFVMEDFRIREFIYKIMQAAAVSKIVIERSAKKISVSIHSARPGMIIGKKGVDIDKIKKKVVELTGADVFVNIVEIKRPELDAHLVANSVAQQLEKERRSDEQ